MLYVNYISTFKKNKIIQKEREKSFMFKLIRILLVSLFPTDIL